MLYRDYVELDGQRHRYYDSEESYEEGSYFRDPQTYPFFDREVFDSEENEKLYLNKRLKLRRKVINPNEMLLRKPQNPVLLYDHHENPVFNYKSPSSTVLETETLNHYQQHSHHRPSKPRRSKFQQKKYLERYGPDDQYIKNYRPPRV